MIIICFLCSDALWKIMSNYMVITCSGCRNTTRKHFSVNYYTSISVDCIIFAPDLLGTPAHRCGVYLRD